MANSEELVCAVVHLYSLLSLITIFPTTYPFPLAQIVISFIVGDNSSQSAMSVSNLADDVLAVLHLVCYPYR